MSNRGCPNSTAHHSVSAAPQGRTKVAGLCCVAATPEREVRHELDEVLAGVDSEEDPIETVGRLGAWLILQQALEDEVSEFLGHGRYERAEETVAHRNGHEQGR